MNLLIHICCAPCAMSVIEKSREDGYSSTGLFYNPNIHPTGEFDKRLRETRKITKKNMFELEAADYDQGEYFRGVSAFDNMSQRCLECWNMRLDKTALYASEKGYDAFTSTLLSSPYQDHEKLKSLAGNAAEKYNVAFYYYDFREYFKKAHDKARQTGVYCQNYCGCIFSMIDREERRLSRKKRSNR